MPPLPPYPNVLRIRHLFDVGVDASAMVNWHMTYTGTAPSDGTCALLAAAIEGVAHPIFVPDMASDVSLAGIEVQDLTSDTAGQGSNFGIYPGTRSGGYLGAAVATLANMPIGRRYRGGKPRSYWPFGTTTDLQSAQLWEDAYVSEIAGDLETYLAGLEGLTESGTVLSQLVSISYYHGFTAVTNPITGRTRDVPNVRTVALAPDPILAIVVSKKVASQRRRNLQR